MDTLRPGAVRGSASAILVGGSANPIPLTDPALCYRVRRGTFDVFAIANSRLDSRRRPLFSLGPGEFLFCLDVPEGPHLGLVAVGSIDSELDIVDADAALPSTSVEGWLRALGTVVSDAPPRTHATPLRNELDECRAGAYLRADPRALRWLRLLAGSVRLGAGGPIAGPGDAFPLAGALQAEAIEPLRFAVDLPTVVSAHDLALFNEACRAALSQRFAGDGTSLQGIGRTADDALDDSLRDIAGLATHASAGRTGAAPPLHAALWHLFDALGVRRINSAFALDVRSEASADDRLAAILSRHRLLSRKVLLRPDWNSLDGSPLLGHLDAERRPVALICRRRRWVLLDGGREHGLDRSLIARLAPDAVQIYPTLPDQPFTFGHLFRFGLVGGGLDRARLVACLLAGAGFASLIPVASHILIDDVLPRGDLHMASLVIVGLFITILARTVFEAVKGIVLLRSELRLETRLQPALVARMMSLPSAFYRAYAVGDIMDRVLGIQQARQILSQQGAGAIVGAAFSLVSLVPIIFIDWRLTLVTLGLALVLGLATAGLSMAELRHERRLIAQKGRLEGFVLQVLMGMAKLRASAAEPMAFKRWARLFRANLDHSLAAERWANVQRTAQAFLPEFATIAIYAAIVFFMKSDAEAAAKAGGAAVAAFSAGAFVAVSASVAQVFGAITALADALSRTLSAVPLIERARPIIATPLDVPIVDAESAELKGEIDVRNLSFRYTPESQLALDGLDLRVGKGEFVAVVGASGSGKSTLMRLLLGFEQPQSGEIFYDGTSMRRIALPDLRRQMGVVLQHGKLFSGSIQANIVGQTGLGMDEAVAAARLVGLDRDIDAMPMGMHTVLLDGAATLSGGQRQRILIARSLVGRPSILLLDEATSALDNRTQAIVTDTLAGLAVTRLVIAHRLSTIEAADRIVVLSRGRVAEAGTFAELMALGGHFAAHARRQLL